MHRKLRTRARRALERDRSAMSQRDRFDQAQPKTQSTLRAALIPAVEPVPDARDFLRGNPFPGVLHRDADFARKRLGASGRTA